MAATVKRKVSTRQSFRDPVFGEPCDLCEMVLPCNGDVMRYFLFVQNNSSEIKSVAEISKLVAEKVQTIWWKASLPTISNQQCVALLKKYHKQFMNLKKSLKKTSNCVRNKLQCFQSESNKKLFDISTCKCKELSLCNCEKLKKVPKLEHDFLKDQRTTRKMFMGKVDAKTTRVLKKRLERKEEIASCSRLKSETKTKPDEVFSDSSSLSQQDTDSDEEFKPTTSTSANDISLAIPSLAKAIDRAGLSSRKGAMIASAVLEDVGLITKSDTSHVIDKCKLDRQRKRARLDLQKKSAEGDIILQALYFDGRKDRSLHLKKENSILSRNIVVEEHVVLIQEPGSNYLGHVTPENGMAKTLASSILNYIDKAGISTSELVAIGCDGTVVNTGPHGGVIHLLEAHFKRPLQWLICQLHANELPLRHMLRYLDGETKGPVSFSGPIGKLLELCEKLPVVNFKKIETELPNVNLAELSTDQKYLYLICQAISTGNCPPNLANKSPGKMSHARWLTTANRILRAYIGTETPSTNLQILVEYILKVYAKVWFLVKCSPLCTTGAQHLYKLIGFSRYLSDELKSVIDPVIQRNGFYGHPENILISMIFDPHRHIRELGFRKIMKVRLAANIKKSNNTIRKFEIPAFNFDCASYIGLINWQECTVTESPLTKYLSDQTIIDFIKTGDFPKEDLWKLPCHTQAVERGVKLVTESSLAVCGEKNRDGWIRTTIESRKKMPKFTTKSEYVVSTLE